MLSTITLDVLIHHLQRNGIIQLGILLRFATYLQDRDFR